MQDVKTFAIKEFNKTELTLKQHIEKDEYVELQKIIQLSEYATKDLATT